MKSEKNRSQRAEAATQTKDTTKKAEVVKKKKKKALPEEAEAKLTDANVTKAAKDAETERHTKYIYPAEVKTSKDKKDFRRKARAKIAEFTKAINKLKKSTEAGAEKELSKKQKEYNEWKELHLTPEA